MPEIYSKTFEVRWADIDPNRHLVYTAYDQYAAHVRQGFLTKHGFSPNDFAESGFGPVIFRQEIIYLKEILFGETITVNFLLGKMKPDGSKWSVVNEVYRQDGQKSAVINTDGAWLEVKTRKLIEPPEKLAAALNKLPHVTVTENTFSG